MLKWERILKKHRGTILRGNCSLPINLLIYTKNSKYIYSGTSINEPLFNEVLIDITNEILLPGQSYSKMYGIKPQYNEPRYNEHIPEAQT